MCFFYSLSTYFVIISFAFLAISSYEPSGLIISRTATFIFLGLGNFIYLEYASNPPFIPKHCTSIPNSLEIIANTFLKEFYEVAR